MKKKREGNRKDKQSPRAHLDPYSEALEEVWWVCQEQDLSFREEMTKMAYSWLKKRGKDV